MAKKRTTKAAKTTKEAKPSTLDPGPSTVQYPWIAAELQHLAVPIDGLELDPKNAKQHDETNIRAVMTSLRKTGQYHALIVNSNNQQVVIGNCRLVAARRLGWTHIAMIAWPMSPAEQARLSPVDNRTGELGEWDLDLLEAGLSTIAGENPDQADFLRWQLALDELEKKGRESRDEGQGPAGEDPLVESYEVVVSCADEEDQRAFFERMKTEGRDCRLLTL